MGSVPVLFVFLLSTYSVIGAPNSVGTGSKNPGSGGSNGSPGGEKKRDTCQATAITCNVLNGTVSGISNGDCWLFGFNGDSTCVTSSQKSISAGSEIVCCAVGQSGCNTALSGTTIGSTGTSGHLAAKAVDGNYATYFEGSTSSGIWLGFDFGHAVTVTRVSFVPRSGYASRLNGASFQVSWDPTFSYANTSTVGVIQSTPVDGYATSLNLIVQGKYRYFRITGAAYGSIAELQAYGCDTSPLVLDGAVIGTSGTWGFGNTKEKAHDGDTNTYYDAATQYNNWVGLDLGAEYSLTSVSVFPRHDYNITDRLVGTLVQVSNVADFSTATTVYTITSPIFAPAWVNLAFSASGTWRYARLFNATFGNFAEFKFYGFAAPVCDAWVTKGFTAVADVTADYPCIHNFTNINANGALASNPNEGDAFGGKTLFGHFPAGLYKATYITGAIKYSAGWSTWSVNYGSGSYWSIQDKSGTEVTPAPGTYGSSWTNIADAIAASAGNSTTFYHFGGLLYLQLIDSAGDNAAGTSVAGYHNPTWQITYVADGYSAADPRGWYDDAAGGGAHTAAITVSFTNVVQFIHYTTSSFENHGSMYDNGNGTWTIHGTDTGLTALWNKKAGQIHWSNGAYWKKQDASAVTGTFGVLPSPSNPAVGDPFGATTFIGTFAAGKWTVWYLEGAMKYSSGSYQINYDSDINGHRFVIKDGSGNNVVAAPGNTNQQSTVAAVEADNAGAHKTFTLAASTDLWLVNVDSPTSDNDNGVPNPTFNISAWVDPGELAYDCTNPLGKYDDDWNGGAQSSIIQYNEDTEFYEFVIYGYWLWETQAELTLNLDGTWSITGADTGMSGTYDPTTGVIDWGWGYTWYNQNCSPPPPLVPGYCATAGDFSYLTATCSSGTITVIDAWYGTPNGECNSGSTTGYSPGWCDTTDDEVSIIGTLCNGLTTCYIHQQTPDIPWTYDPCYGTPKILEVTFTCS